MLTFTFDKAVNVNQIGMRLWGDAIGGDSANVSGFGPLLVGPGDAGSGVVDFFTLNLINVTSFQVIGRGNVGTGVGGFFVGELDVTLAIPTPAPNAQAIPAVNLLFVSLLLGIAGIRRLWGRNKP